MLHALSLCVSVLVFLCSVQSTSGNGAWTDNYEEAQLNIQHLAYDNSNRNIYIGAKNKLIKLNERLGKVTQHHTGNDTFNQVLVIHPSYIISCSNSQTCKFHNPADLSVTSTSTVKVASFVEQPATVAFLGPGASEEVLYVAVSYIHARDPRLQKTTTAVSSRSLTNGPLQLYYSFDDGLEVKNSALSFKSGITNDIKYVSGFYSGSYAYFFYLSIEQNKANRVSNIGQTCKDAKEYQSYVEMPIKCKSGSTYYLSISSAILAKPGKRLADSLGVGQSEDVVYSVFNGQQGSALCLFTIRKIREKFLENARKCNEFDSVGYFQGISSSITCDNLQGSNDFCTQTLKPPLSGEIPLEADAVTTWSGEQMTGLTVSTVREETVAFVGTSTGHLKKVILEDSRRATTYSSIDIQDGSPINSDMVIQGDKSHVYLTSKDKVYRIPVQTCSQYTSCDSCTQANDPYCGWCSLENKCSVKDECENSDLSFRWLSRKETKCFKVTRWEPTKISLEKDTDLEISLEIIPELKSGGVYRCSFGSVQVSATRNGNTLKCKVPPADQLPRLISGKDAMEILVKLDNTDTEQVLAQQKVNMYKCSVHKSCAPCADSAWRCDWCIYSNRCSYDSAAQCTSPDELVVYSKDKSRQSRGAGYCPQITQTQSPIIVPADYEYSFRLSAKHLPEIKSGMGGYQCHLLDRSQSVGSTEANRVNANELECQSNKWTYDENIAEKTLSLKVVWNTNHQVDDTRSTEVELYKCVVKGPDCSQCLSLANTQPQYKCKYCGNLCRYEGQCGGATGRSIQTSCPKHIVDKVYPTSAPREGGTLVTIEGRNLGTRVGDVERVTVAGQQCVVQPSLYLVSRRIVCRVPASRPTIGAVQVTISKNTVGNINFMYKDPQILFIHPTKGPISGGTIVNVNGTGLDTGSIQKMKAYVGDVRCDVIANTVTDEALQCRTRNVSAAVTKGIFIIQFDGTDARRTLDQDFSFTDDPAVTGITPLKFFKGGGRMITVTGRQLDTVEQPKVFFFKGFQETDRELCAIKSSTELQCPSPKVPATNRRKRQTEPKWKMALEMDNVQAVRDLKGNFGVDADIEVYNDPKFPPFQDGKKIYRGHRDKEKLIIDGENLNLAASKEDYTVTIGKELCNVTEVSPSAILCAPPKEQPEGATSKELPQVKVVIGRLEFKLGGLKYEEPGNILPPEGIIGIGVGGGILVVIVIIILVVLKRRANKAEREYKKIQKQLDELESSVRQECKQAFAELQTDMTDLTSDLTSMGIPFWDYTTYTFKVLFPSLQDHPVLHPDQQNAKSQYGSMDPGVAQFSQLLNSKQFLLIFIRTLEARKEFSIRDRSVVASLLMIVLQDKLEYATEILKALLNELIDKSVEKKNPKLMLRRTESVVEKFLTNWLSLCLYGYIKRNAGRSLYMLYKALKHQTEKGPVDAITSESRYSLSEDKLLREKIEPTTLTINVQADSVSELVTCKVLDCDTITQAKEKMLDAIYKNAPASKRPSVHDVNLEWRSGRSGHLPLQDDDVTTELKNGWKRVNRLAHYHVPDGATMALVLKPKSVDEGIRMVNGMIEITGTTLSSITPIITMEEGMRCWHLLKHDDNQNASRTTKVISEIFLTRLLSTKGTLQKFIDDLFRSVLTVDTHFPPAIKYLFDFLDQAAKRHGILDTDVVHTWKSNSLPLRFWVNIIKNPDFVLDVNKPHIVDSCLSVIAQTLMDSCSTTDHKLGKDSPSNKLLFAKDIPRYKDWILKFYKYVQEMPPVSDQEIHKVMKDLSKHYVADLNSSVALRELFKYAHQYRFELLSALEEDPSAKRLHLRERFEQVNSAMNRPPVIEDYIEGISEKL